MSERLPPNTAPKRITGLLVLDSGTSQTVTGRRTAWHDLRCNCGATFRVTRYAVTSAKRKFVELCCDTCNRKRVDRQRDAAKSRKKRSVSPVVTRELIGGRPPITPDAIKTLTRHARTDYYRRALAILTEYVDRCVAAQIMPDWDRGAIEAVQQAAWERRTGTPADADRWTAENRGDGLQIVSYDIYRQPAAL